MAQEPGYFAKLYSMGALVGTQGQGRVSTPIALSPTTTRVTCVPANSKRIACVIQNIHATADCYVYFGEDTNPVAIIYHGGGSLQVDNDLPWTGSIDVAGVGATSQLVGTEISER